MIIPARSCLPSIRWGYNDAFRAMSATTPAALLTRLDTARFNSFHLRLILLTGAGWLLAGYGVTIIGFLLPTLGAEWGVSSAALGVMAGAGMAGMLIGSILAGVLSDRLGRRNTLFYTLLFVGISFLLSAQAWNYGSLLSMRLLTGIGLGAILPVSSTLVTEFSPNRHRGAMSATLPGCWGLGGTAAALVGYTVVQHYGWRPAMWIGGVAFILTPLVRFGLPESLRFLLGKGHTADAESAIERIKPEPDQKAKPVIESPESETGANEPQNGGLWSPVFARITLALWVMWLALNFFYQGAFIWLPVLLAGAGGGGGRSFLLTLVISLGQLPGTVVMAILADRFSRRKLILLSLALLAGGSFLFGLSQSVGWVLGVGFLLMAFNGMAWALAYPFSAELYPTRMRGAATGWANGVGRIGGVLAPIAVGLVIQSGGSLTAVFTMLAAAPFLATLILSNIRLETTGRSLEEIGSS
jgi:putative MFS transporter